MKNVFEFIAMLVFGGLTINLNSLIVAFKESFFHGAWIVIGLIIFFAAITGIADKVFETIKSIYAKWNGKTYNRTYTKELS